MLQEVFDSNVVFVTGKGGVGKTTFSIAISLLKERTLLCDLTPFSRISRVLKIKPQGYKEVEVKIENRSFHLLEIDPKEAAKEYLKIKLKIPIYKVFTRSELFQRFSLVTPGLKEAVTLGKIWYVWKDKRYDLIAVDSPPSGQILGFLKVYDAMLKAFPFGPMKKEALKLKELVEDKKTTLCVISTPEELSIEETSELIKKLKNEAPFLKTLIILNKFFSLKGLNLNERESEASKYLKNLSKRSEEALKSLEEIGNKFKVPVYTLPIFWGSDELEVCQNLLS